MCVCVYAYILVYTQNNARKCNSYSGHKCNCLYDLYLSPCAFTVRAYKGPKNAYIMSAVNISSAQFCNYICTLLAINVTIQTLYNCTRAT